MTLPIDRTALTAAAVNQVPNSLIRSALNIAALTTPYDAIDELNNKVNALISSDVLSQLGLVNVKDYNASGLATTAVGSITTGTKQLTLTTTPDFLVGHGINLPGVNEVASLIVGAAATVSSNVTVTLNGVAKTVAVLNGDTAIQVATKIRAASYPGWTAGGTAGTTTVTFTCNFTGSLTDAVYSAGTTGATGTMTTTTQGVSDQISTVTAINGLVIAIADNSTRTITAGTISHDDKAALDSAISAANAANVPLMLPAGTYNYYGKITLLSTNGIYWMGAGSLKTIIRFTDSTVSACIERLNQSTTSWTMKGMRIKGPGKNNGTNVHGITSRYGLNSLSYNLNFDDVSVEEVSGNGFYITDWFQTYYRGCYARYIKGNGFELGGDQSVTFICSGAFNTDIDGWSWYFYGGKPFLQGLNCGDVGNGLRLGTTAAYTPFPVVSYCRPTILGLNVEHCRVGGTGLRAEAGSDISHQSGISIYSNGSSGIVTYGVYFDLVGNNMLFLDNIVFTSVGVGSGFTNKLYVNATNGVSGMVVVGVIDTASLNSTALACTVNLHNKTGWLSSDTYINSTVGFYNEGQLWNKIKTKTASFAIRRDSGAQDDYTLLCNATSGNIVVSMDYAAYFTYRLLTFKKIDSSANTITINTLGGTFDGAASITLSTQWKYVTIQSDGSNWFIIAGN